MICVKYKLKPLLLLSLVSLLLCGCSHETKVVKSDIHPIQDIRFDANHHVINIDTGEETLVFYDVDFYKTAKPSYVNEKVIERRYYYRMNLLTGEYPREEKVEIYINENSVKDLSRKYADTYLHTLVFKNKKP